MELIKIYPFILKGLETASKRLNHRRIPLCLFAIFSLMAALTLGCDFKLPSPPPELFQKFTVLRVGASPMGIISADLNGDGNQDVVAANSIQNTLSVIFGNGDGTFQQPAAIAVPPEPTSIAAADLNKDGLPDLLVNARGGEMFSVLLGRVHGKFSRPRNHATGRAPLSLTLGDFNNDGNEDVAVTLTFSKLEIYLGRGNGGFKKGATYTTGSRAYSAVAEDFNQDGNLDLALAVNSPQSSSVRIFIGNGDGTFQEASKVARDLKPLKIIKQDMNGDGTMDLLFAAGQGDNLYMAYSNGDGTFQKAIAFSAAGGPFDLVTGQFNNDSLLDVAVANSRSSSFSIVLRNPNGSFWFPTRDYVVEGGTPLGIATADFNNDGLADIAVTGNASGIVEIYLRKRAGP